MSAADSTRRAQRELARRDSIKRDSIRRDSSRRETARKEKATADSLARIATLRARYPEAAGRAVIARGIDPRRYTVKSGDVRAVIMPTPMFVWRAAQARAFKDANSRTEHVDPIEEWGPWTSMTSSWRAVYVIEVTSDKVPWPQLQPDKTFDLKKGDVSSVEVLRDGVAVSLESAATVPAVVNGPAHVSAGKAVSNAFVAAIAPSALVLREDGGLPKIELVIKETTRPAPTRIVLSETMVRRLYDDFAPWRDVLARP